MHDKLIVVEVTEPINLDWCSIFNTYIFYNLHKTANSYYFALKTIADNSIIGLCHFTEVEQGVYKSPNRGTFSGIELIEPNIEYLNFFIEQLELILKNKSGSKMILSTAPFQHNSTYSSYLFNALLNHNFSIYNHELNYTVPIDDNTLVEKMNRNNKKRFNKCEREGFVFEQVFNEREYIQVYNIIAENRKNKGVPITMSFDQLMEMYDLFPDKLYFFKAHIDSKDAVASICIKVNEDILYVFYWGDLEGYEQYSPVAFIANGIYEFGQKNNFKILDAGTSTLNGIPNLGLVKFKENLGMSPALKLTYIKNL